MSEGEPNILAVLMEHELALKGLYEVFATEFPGCQAFPVLAGDEQRHAEAIARLRSDPVASEWFSHDSGLKIQALRSSLAYVESQIDRTRRGGLTLLQALSIAKDLEEALIEGHFSRLAQSSKPEVRATLARLAAETEQHRKVLGEALEAEKRLQ